MKKRLLSAALAFAMVLTMIPATLVTAFAEDDWKIKTPADGTPNTIINVNSKDGQTPYAYETTNSNGTVTYHPVTVQYQSGSDSKTGRENGKWYFIDTKEKLSIEVDSGFVVGTSNSGKWYDDWNYFVKDDATYQMTGNNFTLLERLTINSSDLAKDKAPTSLTFDLNGDHDLDFSGGLPAKFSNLTVTNKKHPMLKEGSVSGISKDISTQYYDNRNSYKPLTLNVSNTKISGGISLAGGANKVTLSNVDVTGGITMNGSTQTENSKLVMSDYGYNYVQTLQINTTDTSNTSTSVNVTGPISVVGDRSNVKINNLTGGQALTVMSNGGTVTIDGGIATNMGDITMGTTGGDNAPAALTVDGKVGDITRNDGMTGASITGGNNSSTKESVITINSAGTADSITSDKGKITIDQGKVIGNVVVKESTSTNGVSIKGPVTITGMVYLGEKGKTNLSITGNGNNIGGIQTSKVNPAGDEDWFGQNLVINNWPTGRDNYFGHLSLVKYAGRGVKGGTFSDATNTNCLTNAYYASWFDTSLQLAVNMQTTNPVTWGLYGKNEMARAISDITSTAAGNGNNSNPAAPPNGAVTMHIIGHGGNTDNNGAPLTKNYLNLMNGGILWAQIEYDYAIGMILPERINGYDIATWISGDNDASVPSGKEQVIPLPSNTTTHIFTLHANDVATSVVKSITKAAAAATPTSSNGVQNKDVRVTMNGTKISITGAIVPAPGSDIATIELDLTTDALNVVPGTGTTGNAGGGTTSGGGSTGNDGEDNKVPDDANGNPGDTTNTNQQATGYLILKNVQVFYNVATKEIGFNKLQKIDGGAIVNEAGELVLNNGTGTHYTISASLVQSASTLNTYIADNNKEVQVTVGGKLSNRTQTEKDLIINAVLGYKDDGNGTITTDAEFVINNNQAILEAINAAQATITNDKTVEGWVTTARNYVWKNGNKYVNTKGQPDGKGKGTANWDTSTQATGGTEYLPPHTGNLTTTGNFGADGEEINKRYSKAYIVPYLVVNVTDYNQNGTLTATLAVNYRVDVSGDTYNPKEYYTVQAGRALSALTGDMATNPVLVYLGGYTSGASNLQSLSANFANATFMHQDGKYVYQQGAFTPTANGTAFGGWAINHAGPNGNGLGTITLNSTVGPIKIDTTAANPISPRAPELIAGVTYDDLQAAIDDTVPGIVSTDGQSETMDTITIGGKYAPTECSITMSGVARKIRVVSEGDRKITSNTNGVDVQSLNGYNYIIQLKKDNVPAGTVAIGATATTNGTVSLSKKSAKSGDTVTVTVLPNSGQTPTGVTVKTNNGQTVKVTPTDVPNQYTFTVPTGATSVTVTPTFKSGSTSATTNASIKVYSAEGGSAVSSAETAKANDKIVVTAQPASGYRTMGAAVSSDAGSVNVTRIDANQFTFAVPANAKSVTVTPAFDKDNGTLFTDVWSTSYYSKAVSWAVKQKITDGIDTYTFGSSNTCTRAQMVTFLWRAAGKPSVAGVGNPFVDVSPTLTPGDYYNAILWAVSKGITDGVDATHFGPSQAVTRAQAVTFLYRYAGSPAASTVSGFADVPASQWYAQAVTWAAGKQITNGTTATTFSPANNCKRCDIVTFLYRDITGDVA